MMKRLPGPMLPLLLFLAIIAIGFWGYIFIEKWTPLESLYMVVTTLSTVGFREVRDLSPAGRIFTIFLIVFGIGTVAYTVGEMVEFAVEGHLFGITRRRRMDKKLAHLKNHYILCGFGRVGHQVAHEFWLQKIPFVVIDERPVTAEELEEKDTPYIIGTSSSEEILEKAGVTRAKGLMAASDSDTENVFITLSAKSMNPNIYIVARASQTESTGKLKRAGADKVILPYFIAGRRMASTILRPVAVDFLDTVMHGETVELSMKEITICKGSRLANLTLEEAQIRQKAGVLVLTIKKAGDAFILSPRAETKIEEGDILIALGTQEQLEMLEKIC